MSTEVRFDSDREVRHLPYRGRHRKTSPQLRAAQRLGYRGLPPEPAPDESDDGGLAKGHQRRWPSREG